MFYNVSPWQKVHNFEKFKTLNTQSLNKMISKRLIFLISFVLFAITSGGKCDKDEVVEKSEYEKVDKKGDELALSGEESDEDLQKLKKTISEEKTSNEVSNDETKSTMPLPIIVFRLIEKRN